MLLYDLINVLHELALVSHANASNYEGRSSPDSSEEIGGRQPSGGLDKHGDREPDNPQRSAEYFWSRLLDLRSPEDLESLLNEATVTLEAWRRTPAMPSSAGPERGSFLWKCEIADDDRPVALVVTQYGPLARNCEACPAALRSKCACAQTVYWYRRRYRGVRGQGAGSREVERIPSSG